MTEENKQVIERAVVGLRTAAAELDNGMPNNEKFVSILREDATNLEKLIA